MIRKLLLILLLAVLAVNIVSGRAEYTSSFPERMLHQIEEPLLHAYATGEHAITTFLTTPSTQHSGFPNDANLNAGLPLAPMPDIPQFRKYQNRHIAPTRMYVGGSAVTVGGVLMFAGYVQDTKYPWSGPYMSTSPLNVFGILIVLVGLSFIASGLMFYSKYKKHTIAPYNKSY